QNLVTVPGDVIGKNIDEATQILQQARLTVVAQDADGTQPVNQVIGMDQQPGKQVPEGTPVTLSYSNNTLMTMPGVQGQSPDQAVATLQSVGWAGDLSGLLQTPQAAPNGSSIGSVVNQDPAAGSVVKKIGTPVRVGVGTRQLTVPNLIGKTQNQAAALLKQAGATNVSYVDAGSAPAGQAGRVKSQSAPANTTLASDAVITVSVYGG
ncbi:MAG TPA: PASTA domain-containing protein, partial [Nakamurella sp.]